MSRRDAHPAPGLRSVAATRSPLAEGTDGCGAGWSSLPKGCPLKTTNATKRRTAPNATAVRLTRSPQRFASPTVTASCSAATFCCLGRRGGAEGLTAPLGSRAALSIGRARRTTSPPGPRARTASCSAATFCCLGRHGGAEGSTGTVSGSSRAVVSTPRSVRAVVSTPRSVRAVVSIGRTRRTTSRQCARTSCSAASFCCPGRRGGPERLAAPLSRSSRAVVSTSRSSRAVLSTGRTRRTTSRQCARTASCSAASFCCPGRRGGTGGLTATVSRSSRLVAQCCQPVVRSEPLRSRARAPAQLRCASTSYSQRPRNSPGLRDECAALRRVHRRPGLPQDPDGTTVYPISLADDATTFLGRADASAATADIASDSDDVPERSKPFLLVGSSLTAIFVAGMTAPAIAMVINVRPTVDQGSDDMAVHPGAAAPPAAPPLLAGRSAARCASAGDTTAGHPVAATDSAATPSTTR